MLTNAARLASFYMQLIIIRLSHVASKSLKKLQTVKELTLVEV